MKEKYEKRFWMPSRLYRGFNFGSELKITKFEILIEPKVDVNIKPEKEKWRKKNQNISSSIENFEQSLQTYTQVMNHHSLLFYKFIKDTRKILKLCLGWIGLLKVTSSVLWWQMGWRSWALNKWRGISWPFSWIKEFDSKFWITNRSQNYISFSTFICTCGGETVESIHICRMIHLMDRNVDDLTTVFGRKLEPPLGRNLDSA